MDHTWLAKVAPGTALREAIDNIIQARTGALIVVGGEPEIDNDCDGGFRVDVPFHPFLLYELAKMDGAILLDRDVKRIRRANVELHPQAVDGSRETGMRHRTAERMALSRNVLVIAISQRRGLVSLYYQDERYVLHDLSYILAKATAALNSLSRYDRLFRAALRRLEEAEAHGRAVVRDVTEVMARGIVAIHIRRDLQRYAVELGRDGHLIDLQVAEYPDLRTEWEGLWRDYRVNSDVPIATPDEWDGSVGEEEDWCRRLGYEALEVPVQPRGYRVLREVGRLPENVIEHLVRQYRTLDQLKTASIADLIQVEGVGNFRASAIWKTLHPQ